MKKVSVSFTIFLLFCFSCLVFLMGLDVEAATESDSTVKMSSYESQDLLDDLLDLLPDLPGDALPGDGASDRFGLKDDLTVLGAFATSDEPELSTELESSCSLDKSINQRFLFSTAEKVFFGMVIRNVGVDSKNITVSFKVTGPLVLNEDINITVPAESICLAFTNLPVELPEGVYKLSSAVSGLGKAGLLIVFEDDFNFSTPIQTPIVTSTPASTPVVTPTPTPAP